MQILERLAALIKRFFFGEPNHCGYFDGLLKLVDGTSENLFVTGVAGTGKSTFLRCLLKATRKSAVVVAPTGLAALNVGGQTIHSFFRIKPQDPIDVESLEFSPLRAHLYRAIDLLVIDEISMVRSDLLDAVDRVLRRHRGSEAPFGGCQVLLLGDLYQLPPVVKQDVEPTLRERFGGPYFFDAPAVKAARIRCYELRRVFRQSEQAFIQLLARVRTASLSDEDLVQLNARHTSLVGKEPENAVVLTATRAAAERTNREHLDMLGGDTTVFEGIVSGSLRERYDALNLRYQANPEGLERELDNNFPAPIRLRLKRGARIIMLKNDPGKRWVNGTVGTVDSIGPGSVRVRLPSGEFPIERETWEQVEYTSKDGRVGKEIKGAFSQFPMRLAWALTIHKAQGQSLERVSVDLANGAFATGQTYVALSRCTSSKGLYLRTQIRRQDIFVDDRIREFYASLSCTSHPDPV